MRRLLFFLFLLSVPVYPKCTPFDIQEHILQSPLPAAFWGISIADARTGETLFAHHAEKNFTPASVSKLFTTFLALRHLGPDYRFRTSLEITGPIDRLGCLNGNLILKGGGDPTLRTEDLHALATRVYEVGVRQINGKVIGDDSLFSGPQAPRHSEVEDLGFSYCPEVSALSLNENCIELTFTPSKDATSTLCVTSNPGISYLNILPHSSSEGPLSIRRDLASNCVRLTGLLPKTSDPIKKRVAVHQPSQYAAEVLKQELEALEIQVQNLELLGPAQVPLELARHQSAPLSEIVERINKESYNLGAELLKLTLLSQAEDPLDQLGAELGIPQSELCLFGGSGLSRHNMVSPRSVTGLLQLAYQETPELLHSLPVSGFDGTLQNRFLETEFAKRIRAKTGTLFGVSALAGFAKARSGREVTFCFFINQYSAPASTARQEMDSVMVELLSKL